MSFNKHSGGAREAKSLANQVERSGSLIFYSILLHGSIFFAGSVMRSAKLLSRTFFISSKNAVDYRRRLNLKLVLQLTSVQLPKILSWTQRLKTMFAADSTICFMNLKPLHLNVDSNRRQTHACVHIQQPSAPRPHHTNPASLFVIQDFNNWLEWLLNLPEVEAWISGWPQEPLSELPIVDYHQSNACKKLYCQTQSNILLSTSSHLQLAFTLFVDWYNPLGNKLSGKQHSMGVLALTCLNLPCSVCSKPCFTYLAGLIPSPNQPDMVTITNLLRLLVDKLLELNSGVRIKTHQFQNGRKVTIKLAVLIGEVIATYFLCGPQSTRNWSSLTTPFKRMEFDGLNLTIYHIGIPS
ncbi:hypothetical protein VP01_2069g1 [Puccinia sorghi]|uniref:Uncharacterized protein n=1 Tax=Puccinia sorghi TaxID=27349 RepID=A0A0L6VAQ4_9BASI|nr:hypothetical protein VP01_2069g1 [Puccinia sorghi]